MLLCVFLGDGAAGEQVRVELMVSPETAVIGQKVEYRTRVWHRHSEVPRFSMPAADSAGALLPLEGFAEVVGPGVTEWCSVFLVAGSGRLPLPGVSLELTDTLSGVVRGIRQFPPQSLLVEGVTPDTVYALHPFRPPVALSGRSWSGRYWLVVTLAAVVVSLGLALFWFRRRGESDAPETASSEVSLLAELEELLSIRVLPAGDVRCAEELGRIIRTYLASACGIDARVMTTTEIARSPRFVQHPFGKDLLDLLMEMDCVKFAGVSIGHKACREAVLKAKAVIGREPPGQV